MQHEGNIQFTQPKKGMIVQISMAVMHTLILLFESIDHLKMTFHYVLYDIV